MEADLEFCGTLCSELDECELVRGSRLLARLQVECDEEVSGRTDRAFVAVQESARAHTPLEPGTAAWIVSVVARATFKYTLEVRKIRNKNVIADVLVYRDSFQKSI